MKKITVFWAVVTLVLLLILSLSACGDTKLELDFLVDGVSYHKISTAGEAIVAFPEDPIKEGYDFDGWYFDEGVWENELIQNSFAEEKLSGNISVYAKWVEKPHVHEIADGVCTGCGIPESTAGLAFSLNPDGTSYTLTGMGECIETQIVVGLHNGLSVTAIAPYAFKYLRGVDRVTIHECVTHIGNYAFVSSSVEFFVLHDNIEYVGVCAFFNCLNMKYSVLGEMKYLGTSENPYMILIGPQKSNSAPMTVEIPASTKIISPDALDTAECFVITVDEENGHIMAKDNVIYSKDGTTLIKYANNNICEFTSFTVPDCVTKIAERAFYRVRRLQNVTIHADVTEIGSYAFGWAYNMVAINVDSRNLVYKSIGGNVYTKDGKALLHYASNASERSFTVPSGVTTIGEGAFFYAQALTDVTIPESVTEIGLNAFYAAINLSYVTFEDTSGWSINGEAVTPEIFNDTELIIEKLVETNTPTNRWVKE